MAYFTALWDLVELDTSVSNWNTVPGVTLKNATKLSSGTYRLTPAGYGFGQNAGVTASYTGSSSISSLFHFSPSKLPMVLDNRFGASMVLFSVQGTSLGAAILVSQQGLAWHIGTGRFEPIANSNIFGESGYYYLEIGVYEPTNTAFLCVWTPGAEVLRDTFTAQPFSSSVTSVYVSNSISQSAEITIDTMYTSSVCQTNWLAPVVVAPKDRGVQLHPDYTTAHSVLDGRNSYDSLGAPLEYAWDLMDAPEDSDFCTKVYGAYTASSTEAHTNKITSVGIGAVVAEGDWIAYDGGYYEIIDKGTDDITVDSGEYTFVHNAYTDPPTGSLTDTIKKTGIGNTATVNGWIIYNKTYYQILSKTADSLTISSSIFPTGKTGFDLKIVLEKVFPTNTLGLYFRVISQEALRTGEVAVLAADKAGIYITKLTVTNGIKDSEPQETIIIAREPGTKSGVVVDAEFVWSYLSDYWKRVEDKGPISEYLTALYQNSASILTYGWQAENDTHLGTVYPYWTYRWTVLDMAVKEIGATTFVNGYGAPYYLWTSAWSSNVLTFTMGTAIGASEVDTLTATAATALEAVTAINQFAEEHNYGFEAKYHKDSFGNEYIYVDANFQLTVGGSPVNFTKTTNVLSGTVGEMQNSRKYKVDRKLFGLDLVGHFIVIRGEAYKIVKITDFEILDLDRELPSIPTADLDCWCIPHYFKTTTDYYNSLVFSGDILRMTCIDSDGNYYSYDGSVVGVLENYIGTTASEPSNPAYSTVLIDRAIQTYFYPIDSLVHSIPLIQSKVAPTEDTELFWEGDKFILDTYRGKKCVHFGYFNQPDYTASAYEENYYHTYLAEAMIAENVYVDNRTAIQHNFGTVVGLDFNSAVTPDVLSYLAAVKGLWFIFSRGRTLENLEKGVNIFFALAIAEEAGTVHSITWYKGSNYGRFVVINPTTGVTRTYFIDKRIGLALNPHTDKSWVVGDAIERFDRISGGAEVEDLVKNPDYFVNHQYLEGDYLYDLNRLTAYHRFLVKVSARAFSPEKYAEFMEFVKEWRPFYLLPVFIMTMEFKEILEIEDTMELTVGLHLTDSLKIYPSPGYDPWVFAFGDVNGGGEYLKWSPTTDPGPTPHPSRQKWAIGQALLIPLASTILKAIRHYFFGTIEIRHISGPVVFDGAYHYGETTSSVAALLLGANLMYDGDDTETPPWNSSWKFGDVAGYITTEKILKEYP